MTSPLSAGDEWQWENVPHHHPVHWHSPHMSCCHGNCWNSSGDDLSPPGSDVWHAWLCLDLQDELYSVFSTFGPLYLLKVCSNAPQNPPGFYALIKFYSAVQASKAQSRIDGHSLFQSSPVKVSLFFFCSSWRYKLSCDTPEQETIVMTDKEPEF